MHSESKSGGYTFACNIGNIEAYYALGNMVATMLVQGGQRCPLFTPSIVDFILGQPFNFNIEVLEELETDKAVVLKAV